jgi:DNA-binding NtrC family response regulator
MPGRDLEPTTTVVRQPPNPLALVVRVSGARAAPTEVRLEKGSCLVGAASECDIRIEDKAISRKHLELRLVPAGVQVRDLGSRNGTWYMGQRIESMVCSPGARVRAGAAELAIDLDRDALERLEDGQAGYRGLVGHAPAMRRLFAMLERLEGSLVSVLVEGDSGTGKELVARAIHAGSNRASAPLVIVNCGALNRELVLSELFGHKRGAFTGAGEDRLGAFSAAHGGTLFLDEIGELPLEMQPALLRALESGEIKRVGDAQTQKVDVRVVAATNRDLRAAADAGTFREDLYYRLAVVKLRMPGLADRPEDIPALAQHFAASAGAGALPPDVVATLGKRSYRGHARELKNAVLAYLAIGALPEAPAENASVLEAALRQVADPRKPYQDQKDAIGEIFSRVFFEALLDIAGGNQSEAARIAGLDRSYLRKLMLKHGMKP